MRFGQEGIEPPLEDALPLAIRQSREAFGHVRAGASPLPDDPGRFQLAVGLDDSVRRDPELQRQRANGKLLSGGEPARRG